MRPSKRKACCNCSRSSRIILSIFLVIVGLIVIYVFYFFSPLIYWAVTNGWLIFTSTSIFCPKCIEYEQEIINLGEFKTKESLENSYKFLVDKFKRVVDNSNTKNDILLKPRGEKDFKVSEKCKNLLFQSMYDHRFKSEEGQDFFLYENFYKNDEKKYGNGFYVDIGAYDPEYISNTYFYDVCLKWKGICIEASPSNANLFRNSQIRTCKLVEKCVSDRKKRVSMMDWKYFSFTSNTKFSYSNAEASCDTLENILDKNGVTKIDFISIDIENSELEALYNFPLRKYDVDFVMIETIQNIRLVEHVIEDQGYYKIISNGKDYIYMKGIPLKVNKWTKIGRKMT